MDKKQKQIIITSVLAVFLIIAWVKAFRQISKRTGKSIAQQPTATFTPELKPPGEEPKQSGYVNKEEKDLEWIRCPFSGEIYSSSTGEVSDLQLEGILWDDEKPQAIINNKVVGLGDSIGIEEVVDIKKDRVILSDGFSLTELKLGR